ncbi:hypothetical protein WME73_36270 [Sorangium sp. So ce302]|uniref:hypothetical protein n=1 Tax=Sorangium sp. So ce302 TaxID=3133297 RepID=UPI003F62D5B3
MMERIASALSLAAVTLLGNVATANPSTGNLVSSTDGWASLDQDPTADDFYTMNRDFYTLRSYVKAFGQRDDSWDPSAGYRANRARILRLYDYYRDTYLGRPNQFLWAGLGRMAGGAVVGGLDFLVDPGFLLPGYADPSTLTTTMVQIGKSIFLDLAWQHEAFLDDPVKTIQLALVHDLRHPGKASYAAAWTKIATNIPGEIAAGNQMLLENEQFAIIQPFYDALMRDPDPLGGFTVRRTRAFTRNVHPYHRDFLTAFPLGDVLIANDRWAWITEPDGMWQKWVAMPEAERTRLATLPMDDLIHQRWGQVLPGLLPPGSR